MPTSVVRFYALIVVSLVIVASTWFGLSVLVASAALVAAIRLGQPLRSSSAAGTLVVMPKRSGTRKPRTDDPNVAAHAILRKLTGEPEVEPEPTGKNPAAVALGRLGGKKGGAARAAAMTAEQRAEASRLAAAARWKKS